MFLIKTDFGFSPLFLKPGEKLILENENEKINRLILVFSDKSSNKIEGKLNNIRLYEKNLKIENQLERFSNLGFGFKVYDFSKKIHIRELK